MTKRSIWLAAIILYFSGITIAVSNAGITEVRLDGLGSVYGDLGQQFIAQPWLVVFVAPLVLLLLQAKVRLVVKVVSSVTAKTG